MISLVLPRMTRIAEGPGTRAESLARGLPADKANILTVPGLRSGRSYSEARHAGT
jgi:hypothetical protein